MPCVAISSAWRAVWTASGTGPTRRRRRPAYRETRIAPARQLHRPLGQRGRLGTVSHRRVGVGGQHVGGAVECQQMVGLDGQGLAPLDDGFRRPAAKVIQGAPQIVMGVGIPGSQRDGLFEMRDRLIRPALRNQGESEIVVDLGQAGVDRQRLFEMRDRLVEPARDERTRARK